MGAAFGYDPEAAPMFADLVRRRAEGKRTGEAVAGGGERARGRKIADAAGAFPSSQH